MIIVRVIGGEPIEVRLIVAIVSKVHFIPHVLCTRSCAIPVVVDLWMTVKHFEKPFAPKTDQIFRREGGGFTRLDRIFDGQLKQVLEDFNDSLWQPAA